MTQPKVLLSGFNRLIVMETNRGSWHSVQPVVVGRNRCCVSNYYFSTVSPENQNYYHVTSFTGRPDQTLQRAWGLVDNFARQAIAENLKISRGSSQTRYNK